MNLWVDDKKDPAAQAEAFGFDSSIVWTWAKTWGEAVQYLDGRECDILALDHDLGLMSEKDGDEVVKWLIKQVLDGNPNISVPQEMYCISWNPVGAQKIEALFDDLKGITSTS